MIAELGTWRHVFKLDPERDLSEEALERICTSGTDAVWVGGSSGVTFDNTVDLLSRIRRYELPCALEISAEDAVVPGFDLYLVPMVLNTDQGEWITGRHQKAIREFGSMMNWDEIAGEGYVILNPDSTAAKVTGAYELSEAKDLAAYARMADKLLSLPVFYVEYSGAFGRMDWVLEARRVLEHSRLFYGGGIDGPDKAKEAAEAAHCVVVGNLIYKDLEAALATVDAVKNTAVRG